MTSKRFDSILFELFHKGCTSVEITRRKGGKFVIVLDEGLVAVGGSTLVDTGKDALFLYKEKSGG